MNLPTYRGKVRDIYDLGDRLILSSSDRISAFDVVFPQAVPNKGKVLNRISISWFEFFKNIPNHILETDVKNFPSPFRSREELEGRSVLVKKCKRIDYECVVRGYIAGSGWKEYKNEGTLAGVKLPAGLKESEKLPEPVFTPAVKNDQGHDENISEKEMENRVGKELFGILKEKSISIFLRASEVVDSAGIILCDTKFEFGILDGQIILIDELLTPDSSRYWSADSYSVGISPPSLDKQILRNYLETTSWNKMPPAPDLPAELIQELREKYQKIEDLILSCISQKSK
ncbi:phosphoribosylaminoimidazolesuccinocarboxamide synthase [Leptospira borgpetersenii]|uniref:Phosphoribosylaminoimidazole-succinocarboxamide synthase n=2 Tax=Leptospira borgpetersenii serovar Hardjo-bovis TaxID=338217 RepID=Q04UP7_LEPBJ|nr:phosphoribosylaminoimidazolesuccinocarboxamide synthase [Leptospira borgpetersenii]ABJ75373.1 Phosphoribosylaminoimidazole-succinocarboxamidesynthase [Leptospira borgpetersenii serovar Hardjo-bovis str. JB197]ABJ79766.1 Phosphoribosylaminoimidazole-succinocarboxamidesynthase [Leptospira borgpetersenii serovar Hardjo-bovis str. L550]AMX59161.1 phosphoribosylaminoimidazole-succinocarboxamide synthase [Leptospira borgpetersenii serovar Hardjo]AMX62390.1 phosphoribosylaminoimidazole-succinocarbo